MKVSVHMFLGVGFVDDCMPLGMSQTVEFILDERFGSSTRCNHYRNSMARGKKMLKKDNFLR